MKHAENRVNSIANLLKSANRNLRKAEALLDALKDEISKSYDDVPGVLGVFNGTHMVTPEGKSYEVNPNYAAKSLLVAGDNLKMVEDEGKMLFKQVSKVDRKRLEGILNKKEGNWFALTDDGSFQLLDVAVEFRDGKVNDPIVVLVPEGDSKATYAALEKLVKEGEESSEKEEKKPEQKQEKTAEAPKKEEPKVPAKAAKKPAPKPAAPKATSSRKTTTKSSTRKKPPAPPKKPAPRPAKAKSEEVASILEEDDLR